MRSAEGGGNVGVVTPSPHGDKIRDSPTTELGGRHRKRGPGDIHVVLSAGTEVGGVNVRRMPGEGK